jgi:uncharacterized protein YegP (UPF0339 family)
MPRDPRFELYRDSADEWRWRLVVANGNIIADSGEGYASKQGAKRGIESVKDSAPDAEVVTTDGG